MAQNIASPVYPAGQVCDLLGLRVPKKVLKQFRMPPEAPKRGIIAWHPGLSLMEQTRLPRIRDDDMLWVRRDLRERDIATAKVEPAYWRACLPAPETGSLSFAGQEKAVLPFGETACPVTIASWIWLVHLLATNESLGRGLWMRCAEEASPGDRIGIYTYADGLCVFGGRGDGAGASHHLASVANSHEETLPALRSRTAKEGT
jgi:hypothetical protein